MTIDFLDLFLSCRFIMSPIHNKQQEQYPCLWKKHPHNKQRQPSLSIDELLERFCTKPPPRSFFELWRPTWVVGQEFSISCLLLAGHRRLLSMEEEGEDLFLVLVNGIVWRRNNTMVILLAFILLVVLLVYTTGTRTQQHGPSNKNGTLTRLKDAFLLAGLLRLISSVLRTLTASYSSDTVHALAIGGMFIHLLACDFNYANGRGREKTSSSSFQGGTVSLNAALLSTTLLASRLSSNSTVYVFVTLSVVLFCFYPAARHAISQRAGSKSSSVATLVVTLLFLVMAWALLQSDRERYMFGGTQIFLCFLAPLWNYSYLQHHKVLLTGPWDIAHIDVTE